MRVIAGQYRSRPLRTLAGMKTRPTSDRLRETLFNVLTAGDPQRLKGSVWIDLFAGTGAVGIEALSRGAGHVTFVDSSNAATKVIRENLKALGIASGFEILESDVMRAVRHLPATGRKADFVFVDPPYAKQELYGETLRELGLAQSLLLKPSTQVIVEHDKRFDPGELLNGFRRMRTLKQGDSVLGFYHGFLVA